MWCRTSHQSVWRDLLPTVRALLVMLQGIWFIQIAQILYTGETCTRCHCMRMIQECIQRPP